MPRQQLQRSGERLIQTIWVGALWTVGYVVAPGLFAHLESEMAGPLAGEFFTIVALLSMVSGTLLILSQIGGDQPRRKFRQRLVGLMMLLIAVGEWGVRPVMEAARLPDGTAGPDFGMWHGIASVLYLLASLAGLWLVVAGDTATRGEA